MCAIESLRNRLTQRATFCITHNHRCPCDRLKREPLQTDCAAKCKNRDSASDATNHAYEISERLPIRQSSQARVNQLNRGLAPVHRGATAISLRSPVGVTNSGTCGSARLAP